MDEQQLEHERIQEQLQRIILQLVDEEVSSDHSSVRDELARRITDAGLQVPPHKWLDDTATDIANRRVVLMDATLARKAEGVEGGD